MFNTQFLGHQTCYNIYFVTGSCSQQQFCLADFCLLLDLIAGTIAANTHNIIDIDDILNQLGVLVNNRDSMIRSQLLCQRRANLTCAYNYDSHMFPPIQETYPMDGYFRIRTMQGLYYNKLCAKKKVNFC